MLRAMIVSLCVAASTGFVCPVTSVRCLSRVSQSKVSPIAMTAVVDEIMDKLKSMTLLEASELVKSIEDTFDVDASAGGGMMMAAPAAVAGAEAAPEEEKTAFDLMLEAYPADKKIPVLKLVREITGLGLKEAKDFVESVPKALKEDVSKPDGEAIIEKLKALGATASLK